ncbi:UNVERIFIED_CONTAM: hypothetical protein PYX00_007030 [Menopon gallinae]|uniref:Coiled-coil domain-containing protein 149 n=1 Tax=Menopon gallinae TaxID=328185 RepID=A0AAW2HI54_9NEOP
MNSQFDMSNMDNYVENILAENLTLKRKLDSKCEALVILNKELSECITEKEQYKILAEQLQKKLSTYKKIPIRQSCFTDNCDEPYQSHQDSKETNRNLVCEVESLRQKLRDALGDIKALRTKLNQQKMPVDNSEALLKQMDKEEELVKQLEAMNRIKNQLEMDLQSVLDEKEELITERDAYKCKIHRLNHEFNMLLKGENHNVIDLDSLILENRFLQEHLQQAQEEIKLANQTLHRYKDQLESKRSKNPIKIGIDNLSETLLSQKQVQDVLQLISLDQISNNSVTVHDLRSICMALLEILNDKTLALLHQKKANRILASRICELEQRIENAQGSRVLTFPSKILLEGYIGSDVDKNVIVNVPQETGNALEKSTDAESGKREDSLEKSSVAKENPDQIEPETNGD